MCTRLMVMEVEVDQEGKDCHHKCRCPQFELVGRWLRHTEHRQHEGRPHQWKGSRSVRSAYRLPVFSGHIEERRWCQQAHLLGMRQKHNLGSRTFQRGLGLELPARQLRSRWQDHHSGSCRLVGLVGGLGGLGLVG